VLSVLHAATAMFAIGLWVAPIARTQRAAGAIDANLLPHAVLRWRLAIA